MEYGADGSRSGSMMPLSLTQRRLSVSMIDPAFGAKTA
jgi:hypothetical protein